MSADRVIQVRVPASSANLGSGFDVLALALGFYLRCSARESPEGLRIRVSGTDSAVISTDASNLIWRAFLWLAGPQAPQGIDLEIANEIPIGKGLGSSAAAILAGLALANEWLGLNRSKEQLVELAAAMEGHPDNVAAAAWGGLVASCQTDEGAVLSLQSPMSAKVQIVVVVPEFALSTEAARAALPTQYYRQDAVFNLQRVALLVAALRDGRTEMLAEAMRDRLHQPYRAPLVPGFDDMLELRNLPGLLGVALSGAGPSVLAFCSGQASEVGEAMVACFRKQGIQAAAYCPPVDEDGLVVERAER